MRAQPMTDEVEARTWAFEAALAAGERPDLTAFLPPADSPDYLAVLRELACIELERTQSPERRTVEHYLTRFPQLAVDPEAVAALNWQAARPPARVASSALPGRTPGWREHLAKLHEEYQNHAAGERTAVVAGLGGDSLGSLVGAPLSEGDTPWPQPGQSVLGFRLIRELGRGTFGRVYLAEQTELASRLVVLKIGSQLFVESTRLAQLQHTHVMPIYSAMATKEYQVLCMPYLGETTLADVLAVLRRGAGETNAVWSTLEARRGSTFPEQDSLHNHSLPDRRPTPASLEVLRTMPHARTVLWIGARLADALAHAHERHVLHRDIKPENVLIADDGTPLLLDFNLSADPRSRGGKEAILGGTLPYMAPEHLGAFRGEAAPVDERSDVYSLGVLLFEFLTGRQPFPIHVGRPSELYPLLIADRKKGPPRARAVTTQATPALDAILARCLDPDPNRRYPTARALQEDLQRQLDDLPLVHTREPSVRERVRKFVRRHSRGLAMSAAAIFLLALLGAGGLALHLSRLSEQVEVAAARATAINELATFMAEARAAKLLLGLPSMTDAVAGEERCRSALARYELPERTDWQNTAAFRLLAPDRQAVVTQQVPELLLLWARAIRVQAVHVLEPTQRSLRFQEALRLNELAERLGQDDYRRPALLQRALLLKTAGQDGEAESALGAGRSLPPVASDGRWLEVGEMIARGEFRMAEQLLDDAITANPSDPALWAIRGACAAADERPSDAVAHYSTVLALMPEFWQTRVWRAGALLANGQVLRAQQDLDAVLAVVPDHAPALLFRGIARLRVRAFPEAEADLTRALEREPNNTRIYFIRSQARQAQGNAAGAAADRAAGLELTPGDELSWIARGVARQATDPHGAVYDFNQAQRLNPNSRVAAQNKAATLSEFLGRTEEAIQVLDGLLTRFPNFVDARIGRAVLHARLGNCAAAHADVAAALRVDQSAPTLYRAGCAYALTAKTRPQDADAAFRYVTAALLAGCTEDVATDHDLVALRAHHDEYARLLKLAAQRSFKKE